MARTGRPKAEKVRVQCSVCGVEMERYPSVVNNNTTGRFFCSKECRNVLGSKPRRKPDATCQTCGKVFYPLSGAKNLYCSKVCHDKGQTQPRTLHTCEVCGKEFGLTAGALAARAGNARFCSNRCKGQSLWQRPLDRKHNGKPALLDQSGYVKVWEPDRPVRRRWVLEHRLVAEQALGRPLRSDEHVHHINGDKQDNRPENLEVVDPVTHQAITVAATQERIKQDRDELEVYRRLYGPLPGKET
jgi:hypothetical protein